MLSKAAGMRENEQPTMSDKRVRSKLVRSKLAETNEGKRITVLESLQRPNKASEEEQAIRSEHLRLTPVISELRMGCRAKPCSIG
jgi:hypothetical protein